MTIINFAFFGTSEFSVVILQELAAAGYKPRVVVTALNKPQGRDLEITPPPVKVWADKEMISVIQPESLKTPEFMTELNTYKPETGWDVFIVASYGKLIPDEILNLPGHKTLNVHPSLLPKFRGASPVQTAILQENETGVTIIRLDAEMDHGPIVAQAKSFIPDWPISAPVLENQLAHEGGKLLAEMLEKWIEGKVKEVPQDDSKATYTAKIRKEDGLINLNDDPHINFRKIKAYAGWPNAHFQVVKNLPGQDGRRIRIIIKDAEMKNGELFITRIIPEGKQEMNYADFMRQL